MFKKEEQKSVVQQLKGELSKFGVREFPPYGFSVFAGAFGEDTRESREDFAEILEPFIRERLEEDYRECSECGCLVAKDKALMVKTRVISNIYKEEVEKHYYCKYCKPPYDEILKEWDENEEKKVVVGYVKNGVKCDEKGKVLK